MRLENSFIPVRGVGQTRERRLWRDGVTRWDEFDGGLGPTLDDRVHGFVATARDRLADGDADFFAEALPGGSQWRLYEDFRAGACFLDIETTGLSRHHHDVTTVSLHRGGETETLVRGRDLTTDALAEALSGADLLVTFNGKRFDVPFLETAFDATVDLPHLDLLYPCRQVGLSGGLKAVEAAVDVERDRPDISGRDAVRLWRQYERGDDAALDTLVAYNREDTENLRVVADEVTAALHDRVFPDVGGAAGD